MSAHPYDGETMFDYVIIGGGTAGLALAARLSEDAATTVVVLEAGEPNIGDPNILKPGRRGCTFTNPKYDWAFPTEKQKYSNEREYIWNRGKGLGGSSGLNFFTWVKPPALDIDAIEKLGNPGWNWTEYMKYSQRSETCHPPSQEQIGAYPHINDAQLRQTSGPIQTTVPFHHSAVDALFQQTLANKGLKRVEDPYGGDINGTWMANANLDPRTWTRSYAVTGYLLPAQGRPNLTVLTEVMVARILFDDAVSSEPLRASGVDFVYKGRTYQVYARREVVLSAGCASLSTSQMRLDISGVGRREVLRKIGVDVKIELDGVGENVQEHTFIAVSFELVGTHDMSDAAAKLHAAAESGPESAGVGAIAYFPLAAATPDAAALVARAAASIPPRADLPPGRGDQLDLQLAALRDAASVDLELIAVSGSFTPPLAAFPAYPDASSPEPDKRYMTISGFLNHPLSRGTIHATSADPFENPSIDPRYFENDFDLEILVQHVKYIRSMAETEPFKSGVVREVVPGPDCTTEAAIREYIKNTHKTSWHTVGSCSMLPRAQQGVVDPALKVYGTRNLRVVDIGIVPLHIAAHTQATAYMIAEKAADIIRASAKAELEARK
ncbi:GMC oxidoreductase [Mycena pura]|uniref:GMC oxidoreductase n=1 Tax=Mycena pura TaxID=153505 RepID=A0AAD6UPA9_9AGAR|nr:GMC oxidoreductase [Mycena pura]